jgi:hypothetical protein
VAKRLAVGQPKVRQLADDDPEFPEPVKVERRGQWVRLEGLAGQHQAIMPVVSEVEKKSRAVLGLRRHAGQDLHGPLNELVQEVGPEIEWELDEVVPAMRRSLEGDS